MRHHPRRCDGGAGARQQALRHGAGRHRLRAAGRWTVRRTRPGHHHRRRLSVLRDAAPALHPGRRARARAVHPQHGDRRIGVGRGGAAGGCAQGPAGADAAACGDRLAARHPPVGAGGEQDGPGRLRAVGVRQDRHRLLRAAGQARTAGGDRDPGLRARRRQRDRAEHAHALVFGDNPVDRAGRCGTDVARGGAGVPHAGAACRAAGPHVPRLCRHGGDRDHPPGCRRGECDVRRRGQGGAHRHDGRRSGGSVAGPGGDAGARSRDRCLARRRAGGGAASGSRGPGDRLGGVDGRDTAVPRPRLSWSCLARAP